MTLAEIASVVTTKVGQTDASSVAACKLFANARWREIWDAAPWREALSTVTFTPNPPDGLNIVVPSPIDRVMKVRVNQSTGSQTMIAFEQATVFDYDPSMFDTTGTPIGFTTQAPSALTTIFPYINPATGSPTASKVGFGVQGTQIIPVPGSPPFYTYPSTGRLDSGLSVTITGQDEFQNRQTETVTMFDLSGGVFPDNVGGSTANKYLKIYEITKEATNSTIAFNFAPDYLTSLTLTPTNLRPGQTTGQKYQVIQLLNCPAPVYPTLWPEVLILGKRVISELLLDTDQPSLACDNVLLAMTQGDMLERQRQYSKAQSKFSEGKALLEIMLDVERNQTSTNTRIIPALIHSEGWCDNGIFGDSGKFYW